MARACVCVREYVYECTHPCMCVRTSVRVYMCTCVPSHFWLLQLEARDGVQHPTMHKQRLQPRAAQCKLSLSRPEPLLQEQPRSLRVSVPGNQGTAHLQPTGPGCSSPCSLGVQDPHPRSSA